MCYFMDSVCVSSCRCCVFVSVVHPVTILSEVICVIRSLCLMLVVTIWWKRTRVWGLVMAFVCCEDRFLLCPPRS